MTGSLLQIARARSCTTLSGDFSRKLGAKETDTTAPLLKAPSLLLRPRLLVGRKPVIYERIFFGVCTADAAILGTGTVQYKSP